MTKARQILTVSMLCLLIGVFCVLHIALPDAKTSTSERRKLASVPKITIESIFSSKFSGDLETYLLDQFPARDGFRMLKAIVRLAVFRQSDNNGIYLAETPNGTQICKQEYPTKENQVQLAIRKMNSVYETYLEGMNVYYAIVPDKNYYIAGPAGQPALDYARIRQLMRESMANMTYIDLFDTLTINDYYRTDTHWKQEKLEPVVKKLAETMGFAYRWEYETHTLAPFRGVYYGQSALAVEPDTLTYLTNAATESATVTSVEEAEPLPVYTTDLFAGIDGYDTYLSGAQALMTIVNPDAATDRELIIFRDSFGSSIAPLLIDSYAKITLIDLRYVSSALLGRFVEFADQDVLFLYSTLILNSGGILK
ncbi:MAG: DHHW family protein [Clostridiaceae bacterium]|nr:DHHW family protein [Clostridiaceae bacterium]